MRIIYPANVRFPVERASSVQMMNTCRSLVEQGHQVDLLVRQWDDCDTQQMLAFYGLEPHENLKVHFLPLTSCNLGRYRNRIWIIMVVLWLLIHDCFRKEGHLLFLRDIGMAYALLKLKTCLPIPLVYEAHSVESIVLRDYDQLYNQPPPNLSPERAARYETFITEKADGLVATSEPLLSKIKECYPQSNGQPAVVPNGCAITPCTLKQNPEYDFIYVGQFYHWKGFDDVLKSLQKDSTATLLVCGGVDGESDGQKAQQLAQSLGLENRVCFQGFVPPQQLADHLSNAKVGIVSLRDSEVARWFTSPMKMVEYMGVGLGVVAADFPTTRAMGDGLDDVSFYQAENIEDMSRAMTQQKTRWQQGKAREANLKRAQQWSWSQRGASLSRYFQEVLDRTKIKGGQVL